MTDTPTTTDPGVEETEPTLSDATEPTDADPVEPAAPVEPDGSPEPVSESGEAARYRRRLRDTESQLADVRARLERMQRAEIERLAADHLAHPGDLWLLQPDTSTMLTDNGDIDAARVAAVVADLLAERPGWKLAASTPRVPTGPRGQAITEAPTFAEALRRDIRGG